MLDGLKILCERIKTHPEEFCVDESTLSNPRWAYVMRALQDLEPALTTEEKEAVTGLRAGVQAAIIEQKRQRFTELVVDTLVNEPQRDLFTYSSDNRYQFPTQAATATESIDSNMIREFKEALKSFKEDNSHGAGK